MNQRNDFTWRLLEKHIAKGMHVLDVGCGMGDLTFLASQLTGQEGQVTGIDMSDMMLDMAEKRKEEKSCGQVSFRKMNLENVSELPEKYDAIIGRRILMYLPQPEKVIEDLKKILAPGGIMIFQESDAMGTVFNHEMPLQEKVQDWIWETVKKENGNIHIGSEMYGMFKDANMEVLEYVSENILQTADSESDLAWVAKMMKERITKYGIVTESEMGLETLEERLKEEREQVKKAFVRDVTFGICVR